MKRIPTPDERFHDGNKADGTLGTLVVAEWLNNVQEELAAVIEGQQLPLDGAKQNQLAEAIAKVVATHADALNAHQDSQIELSAEIDQAPGTTDVAAALAALGVFAANGYQNVAIFDTSGVTSWAVPDVLKNGLRKAHVTVIGGGAGGAREETNGGGGGGAGGVAIKLIDLTGVSSIAVTVGVGGTGGATDNSDGVSGGASSFGTYCSATGGDGAIALGNSPAISGGGQGGDINYRPMAGSHPIRTGNGTPVGGYGGGAYGGPGGTLGRDAGGVGGGGGGASNIGPAGNGFPGIVIVRW